MAAPRSVTVAAACLLGWASSSCSGDASEPAACADPVSASTVRLEDFAFEPDCVRAHPGATIRLRNDGDAPHSFTVQGTSVSVDLEAGSEGDADLSGLAPRRYAVTCIYHPQMTATLTVG